MTDGINIPRAIADAEGVPDELDAGLTGPYVFPDPRRRRVSGFIYVVGAGLTAWAGAIAGGGYFVITAVLLALAAWHFASAWELRIEQEQALAAAAAAVPFVVGHASAAVTFVGLRARPQWQVIVYSPEDPPARRALVQVDGISGATLGDAYVEDVPEI